MLLYVSLIWFHKKLSYYIKGIWRKTYSKVQMRKIFNLGFPSALQMLFEVAFFTSAIWVCGLLGKNEQAAKMNKQQIKLHSTYHL